MAPILCREQNTVLHSHSPKSLANFPFKLHFMVKKFCMCQVSTRSNQRFVFYIAVWPFQWFVSFSCANVIWSKDNTSVIDIIFYSATAFCIGCFQTSRELCTCFYLHAFGDLDQNLPVNILLKSMKVKRCS